MSNPTGYAYYCNLFLKNTGVAPPPWIRSVKSCWRDDGKGISGSAGILPALVATETGKTPALPDRQFMGPASMDAHHDDTLASSLDP